MYGEDINGYIDHYVNFGLKEGRVASINSLSTVTPSEAKVAQQIGAKMADSLSTLGTKSTFATNYLELVRPQFEDAAQQRAYEANGNRTLPEIMEAGDTPDFTTFTVDYSACTWDDTVTVDDIDWGWDE